MGEPLIQVISAGPFSSIQDLGFEENENKGFITAGAMDQFALRVGNRLVGNQESEAAIEMTLFGGEYLILNTCLIAVTGADLGLRLNGRPQDMWTSFVVKKGDRLQLLERKKGTRAYLCVQGGFEFSLFRNSKSTDFTLGTGVGGYQGRKLRTGDILKRCSKPLDIRSCGCSFREFDVSAHYGWNEECMEIRVLTGTDVGHFTDAGLNTFFTNPYTISPLSSRQGIQLEGAFIEHNEKGANIITSYVPLGTVQVAGKGTPIILMRDKQTVGGYTKIATVISVDIDRLAQRCPGEMVRFQKVSLFQAHRLLKQQERQISKIGRE